MPTNCDILQEPTDSVYRELIDFSVRRSAAFGLVLGTAVGGDPTEQYERILRNLSPFLQKTVETSSWPGTVVYGYTTRLHIYSADVATIPILSSVGRLFGWQYPDAPDDLHFYTESRECWLTNTAHESEAFIDAILCPPSLLKASVPGIILASQR